MKQKEVFSVQEALSLGYRYVIAWRDHYRGNSKGEVYVCNETNANVCVSHENMDDRTIHPMFATNEDVLAILQKRKRIINLISDVEFSMTVNSKLFNGVIKEYVGKKMVFGTWRSIYRSVIKSGASNFNSKIFWNRHNCILNRLRELVKETDGVSITMPIYQ